MMLTHDSAESWSLGDCWHEDGSHFDPARPISHINHFLDCTLLREFIQGRPFRVSFPEEASVGPVISIVRSERVMWYWNIIPFKGPGSSVIAKGATGYRLNWNSFCSPWWRKSTVTFLFPARLESRQALTLVGVLYASRKHGGVVLSKFRFEHSLKCSAVNRVVFFVAVI